jgi:hypothetical protein
MFFFSLFLRCRLKLILHDLQVAMFVGLAMVLRRKPEALISVLPRLRDNTKYQGRFQVLVITWMVAQVRSSCQIN